MTKQQIKLTQAYKRYHRRIIGKKSVLSFLRSFIPEMIFRTTRLEGERVSRRTISSLFK